MKLTQLTPKILPLNFLRWLPAIFVTAALVVAMQSSRLRAADDTMSQPAAPAHSSQLHYLTADRPDAIALLAPPPLPDSPEQAADLAQVQVAYHAASSNDMATAYSEKKFSVFTFMPAVGEFFQSNNLPKTAAFFESVQKQAEIVTDNAKNFYKRPRPFTVDTSLANGKLEKSFGYPSGHSTESMVLALMLADLFPDKHDAIIAKARSIGWHRVEIARHYLTDIYAGRVLAQAIVREMKSSPDFQRDFTEVQGEIGYAKNR